MHGMAVLHFKTDIDQFVIFFIKTLETRKKLQLTLFSINIDDYIYVRSDLRDITKYWGNYHCKYKNLKFSR